MGYQKHSSGHYYDCLYVHALVVEYYTQITVDVIILEKLCIKFLREENRGK